MPLRVAEINGLWLKDVNQCDECPFVERHPEKVWVCENPELRQTEREFQQVYFDCIPVWCPLPRDEGDGKITVTGDKIEPLIDPHRPESLDREFR